MEAPLFTIKNLSCSYTESVEERVLYIKEMDIPKGEVVFLLGASGSGKSTLLEALGLMNDTIRDGEVRFFPLGVTAPIPMDNLWQEGQEHKLAAIRKDHLSFIFQETNLMENFTAYENICLSQMIKAEVPFEEVLGEAKGLMEEIHLPESQVGLSTLAVNLSGGQRQRVAFVRSLNSQFSVLFGDEPTGNLDEKNANELMRLIKGHLEGKKSAVIVSHDVRLALKHADRIIVITKPGVYGEVLPENVFERQAWENLDDRALLEFRRKLTGLYQLDVTARPGLDQGREEKTATEKVGQYPSLFIKKEGRALMGSRLQNFFILSAMLLLTLLSIGFANGSLVYLDEKMNNPFVNWLNITVPFTRASDMNATLIRLNQEEEKQAYNYTNVSSYVEYPVRFQDVEDQSAFIAGKGRSFDLTRTSQNSLLRDILSPKNIISGDTAIFRGPRDFRIIVTQRFLQQLHYSEEADFIYMGQLSSKEGVLFDAIPIPVKNVVKEIPGKNAFALTSCFLNALINPASDAFEVDRKKDLNFFVEGEAEKNEVEDALRGYMDKHADIVEKYQPDFFIQKADRYLSPGWTVNFTFGNNPSPQAISRFYEQLISSNAFETFRERTTRFYRYAEDSPRDCSMDDKADRISINFESLDKVRDFSNHLLLNYNDPEDTEVLEVDTGKIKEKENFNFLSKVTYIISFLLVIFGLSAISLFLSNVLKMHFNKIQMNIGTFKAFGLDNRKATRIYFIIILRFLGLSLIFSFALMLLLGYGVNWYLISRFNVEKGIAYFQPFHDNTWLTLLMLVLTTVVVSLYTIRKLITKTPGDLIYKR